MEVREIAPPLFLSELYAQSAGRLSMAIAIKGYYDGSGSPATDARGEILSLAGYGARPAVWYAFEAEWWRVLDDDTNRPKCRWLHMTDANALQNEFSPANGWDKSAVRRLLNDLFNRCFSPRGYGCDIPDAVIGAACSVDLAAYERVCAEFPHFREKEPHALCVDHVVGVALSQLVPAEERMSFPELLQRKQSIAVFFDRGEFFRHYIWRMFDPLPWHRRPMPVRLVSEIGTADQESSAAMQAADYLAWHTTRDVAKEGGDLLARSYAMFSSRTSFQRYDYDELVKTAKRWKPGKGYGGPEPNA